MAKRPPRPRDPNQLAKLIVELSTGEASDPDLNAGKDQAAVQRGRVGGLKGGIARKRALPRAERSRIARIAARKRWGKTQ